MLSDAFQLSSESLAISGLSETDGPFLPDLLLPAQLGVFISSHTSQIESTVSTSAIILSKSQTAKYRMQTSPFLIAFVFAATHSFVA